MTAGLQVNDGTDPWIAITRHDAKIIAAMLRGYAELINGTDIFGIQDAGIRFLLLEEIHEAESMRQHLYKKLGVEVPHNQNSCDKS